MADETIEVSLVPNDNPPWKVIFPGPNGGSFTVDAGDTDTINWVIADAPPGAAISAIQFSNSNEGDIPWIGGTPTAPGWSTTDTNNLPHGHPPVHWPYTVTMTYENYSYVSDPEITNKPPVP
jgi:hypothetical protein